MTTRAITVLLTAVTGPYVANMGRAAGATSAVGTAATGAKTQTGALGGAMSGLSGKLLAGGGLLFALKQGADMLMSYEDALVGVGKTTGLTGADLSALGDDLTDLSKGIRGSAEDMLGIAQSAAQLGVSNDNIVEFTEVIANMASATDLTVESAATDMARLSNVLGRPIEDVEALGSSIVALGNNMATTEPEILNLATRLAAAGRTAGLSDSDVVGLAAAMSELGIEAEAGGTAMSRVLNEVTKAVGTGSDEVELFAQTASMSAQEFSAAWTSDPQAALQAFLEGLGQLSEGDRFTVMEELGLDAARLTDVLLRTSAGADGLADAFALSADAMEDNTALADEAATANATLSTAVENLGDSLKDLVTDMAANEQGASLAAGAVNLLSGGVEQLSGWMSQLEVSDMVSGFGVASAAARDLTGDIFGVFGMDPPRSMSENIHGLAVELGLAEEATSDAEIAQRDLTQSLVDAGGQAAQYMAASSGVTSGLEDLQVQLDRTVASNETLADSMLAASDPAYAYVRAQEAAQQAAEAYSDAVDVHGDSSDEAAAALLDLLEAEQKVDATALRAGESFDDLSADVDRLERSGRLSAEQADRLRESIAGAREEAEQFAGEYRADLDIRVRGMEALQGARASIMSGPWAGGITERAHGGPVDATRPYLVGEQGPELFWPDTAGRIMPAGETARMGAGASSTVHDNRRFVAQLVNTDEQDAIMTLRKMSLRMS